MAGDVAAPGPWQQHARGCELFIHTAAIVSNTAPPEAYRRVTVGSVRHALDAAVAARARRFVLVSSCGAYGWHHAPNADEKTPVTTLSGNRYQDAKAASEHPALAAHASGEIKCTIVRPGDVYGSGSRPWILLPLEAIRRGLFFLPARGLGLLSPIYIDDLVEGIHRAAMFEEGCGHIFNLVGPQTVLAREFFSYHIRWAGKSGSPRTLPTALAACLAEAAGRLARALGQPSELSRQTMLMLSKRESYSIEKARRMLGFQPRVELAEGMARVEADLRAQGVIE